MKLRPNALVLAAAGALAFANLPATASADTVVSVDHNHTSAAFTVAHLTITKVSGKIPLADATMSIDANDIPTAVKVTFDLAKITTGVDQRDSDLRSEHWFDVTKTPDMTFVSTKIERGAAGAFTMTGDLTMHGVTKPVTLAGTFGGKAQMQGKTHLGYSATGTLDRTQWNVGSFPPAIVGNDVAIEIELEAIEK